jgi:hypothetical protein
MRVTNPPKALQRFNWELNVEGTTVVLHAVGFRTHDAAREAADWLEDVLVEGIQEAHGSDEHND